MNRNLVVVLMMIAATVSASAQKKNEPIDPKAREAYIQLHDQMLSWARTAIVPQARTWKAQLDAAMEPADLQQLNALRARASALNARRITIMKSMGDAWRADNQEGIKAGKQQLYSLLPEGLMLLEELRPLGLKYRSTLEAIGTDARPYLKEWKKEGMERFQSWRTQNSAVLGDGSVRKGGMHKMGHFGKIGGNRKLGAALFMLWDGGDLDGQIGAESLLDMPALD